MGGGVINKGGNGFVAELFKSFMNGRQLEEVVTVQTVVPWSIPIKWASSRLALIG